METLKDIFVTYDIAVQLKEIGFDEPCIFYYDVFKELMIQTNGTVYWHRKESIKIENYNLDVGDVINLKSAPTWEQVKKWFRGKGVVGYLFYFENSDTWVFHIKDDNGLKETSDLKYETYEQAREQLILKLIEIYKNEQNI
ncbi:hypothetical protein [Capnocytophaga cynodegmi]|uniref:hypothetical protein n=1 Tax=Capnocytophaga cynodegmi TaxID=28189 RepID=UPI0038593BF5